MFGRLATSADKPCASEERQPIRNGIWVTWQRHCFNALELDASLEVYKLAYTYEPPKSRLLG